MTWWWEWFDEHGMIPYMRNARLVSDQMLKAGKGEFKQFQTVKNGKAEAYAVRCGKKTFVYVYNGGEDVLDEISIEIGKTGKVKVSALDPENVKFGKAVTMKSDGTLMFEGLGLNKWEEKVYIIK
jgi:ribosome biogenesis protein Nip4